MRGRTNIGGSGLDINGSEVNYTVKVGETINEGDFVQFDDSIIPSSVSPRVGSNAHYFLLSDGRQIVFSELYGQQRVDARIDSVGSEGLISSILYENVASGLSQMSRVENFHSIIQTAPDTFVLFHAGGSGSEISVTIISIFYDVLSDTFSLTFGGWIRDLVAYRYSELGLFYADYIGDQKIFIICAKKVQSSDTDGKLTALVYDLQTRDIVTSKIVSAVDFVYNSSAYDSTIRSLYENIKLSNNVYLYSNDGGTKCYIFTYDGTNITAQAKDHSCSIVYRVAENKFLEVNSSSITLVHYDNGSFVSLGTYILPYAFNYSSQDDRMFTINNKLFLHVYNSSNNTRVIFGVLYDVLSDTISFSNVSVDVISGQMIAIAKQYLCTYSDTQRQTVREENGSFYSFSPLQTVKPYDIRIDGVASARGVGGDTITVFVPDSQS